MSVDFDLFVKSKKVASLSRAACFYSLGTENGMAGYVTPKVSVQHVDGVLYKVNIAKSVSLRNAVRWTEAVLQDFNLHPYFPEQSVKKILTTGFFVDGTKVSGPLMNGTLCLIRCLEEEPDIVRTFNQLIKIEGMDNTTAIILAHGLRWNENGNTFIKGTPYNSNHTAYTGQITAYTLKEAWDKVWLERDKELPRWVNPARRRDIRGVFRMFAPEGNKYGEKTLFTQGVIYTPSTLQKYCEQHIFPLRKKHFAAKK